MFVLGRSRALRGCGGWLQTSAPVKTRPVSRSTKSAAESAGKPAIIFAGTVASKAREKSAPKMLPTIVIDTNVVLDWLVFEDPAVHALTAAFAAGHVDWIATVEMRDELAHVLERGLAAQRSTSSGKVLAAFDAHARVLPCPPPSTTVEAGWRCSDPDDQKFIDLARHAGARWLLSRDRAVLKLARRARSAGLRILVPSAWRRDNTDEG